MPISSKTHLPFKRVEAVTIMLGLRLGNRLLADVRHLIDAARQRVAGAVNAELTQLYWQIGRRINSELLQG